MNYRMSDSAPLFALLIVVGGLGGGLGFIATVIVMVLR